MTAQEYAEFLGERISNWIEKNLTYENGCKRDLNEDDVFEQGEVSWVFTQKGQRLYDSYLRRTKKIIELKYPNEIDYDLEYYTGVIYP